MLANASAWTLLFIIVHLVVIALLSWQTYRYSSGADRYLGRSVLTPWFVATLAIVHSGMVEDMSAMLSPLGIVLGTVVVAGLALLRYWQPLRRVIQALPLPWLMGIQVYRVIGIVFLFGWLEGSVPVELGPLTAFNDILVSVTALLMARLAITGRRIRLMQAWNIFGLLDFAYAITVGVLAAPHALQVLQLTPDSSALGLLPLSLIALWAVPLSIFLLPICLMRLQALRQMN